ncbi:hypothetical protein MCOR34_010031 [Pyricularia oryzae]|nr:hypothetical protein MCOR34_010031 [Pyricularia oryzae]
MNAQKGTERLASVEERHSDSPHTPETLAGELLNQPAVDRFKELVVAWRTPRNQKFSCLDVDEPDPTKATAAYFKLSLHHESSTLARWIEQRGYGNKLVVRKEVKAPRQRNNIDCGVYVLAFADKILEDTHKFVTAVNLGEDLDWEVDAAKLRNEIKIFLSTASNNARSGRIASDSDCDMEDVVTEAVEIYATMDDNEKKTSDRSTIVAPSTSPKSRAPDGPASARLSSAVSSPSYTISRVPSESLGPDVDNATEKTPAVIAGTRITGAECPAGPTLETKSCDPTESTGFSQPSSPASAQSSPSHIDTALHQVDSRPASDELSQHLSPTCQMPDAPSASATNDSPTEDSESPCRGRKRGSSPWSMGQKRQRVACPCDFCPPTTDATPDISRTTGSGSTLSDAATKDLQLSLKTIAPTVVFPLADRANWQPDCGTPRENSAPNFPPNTAQLPSKLARSPRMPTPISTALIANQTGVPKLKNLAHGATTSPHPLSHDSGIPASSFEPPSRIAVADLLQNVTEEPTRREAFLIQAYGNFKDDFPGLVDYLIRNRHRIESPPTNETETSQSVQEADRFLNLANTLQDLAKRDLDVANKVSKRLDTMTEHSLVAISNRRGLRKEEITKLMVDNWTSWETSDIREVEKIIGATESASIQLHIAQEPKADAELRILIPRQRGLQLTENYRRLPVIISTANSQIPRPFFRDLSFSQSL